MNFSKRRIKMNNLKPSGIEWIGSIPVDWKTVPIYYVAEEVTTKNKTLLRKNAFKFFFGNIINKPNFNPDEDNYVNKTIRNYIIVNPGDIVINGLNLNFDFVTKRVGMVTRPGTITSAYISLRPKANVILPKYMLYILRTYDSEKAFHNMGGGVRKILNYDELSKSKIILPSISAQTRIIKFLDKKVSQIDDISKKIQQEITDLEAYRKSVITKTITKGLNPNVPMKDSGIEWIGKIPTDWSVIRLKYLGSAGNGLTYSPQNMTDESGTLILRSSNIQHGEIVNADNVYVNSSVSKSLILKKDDLLICSRHGSKDLIGKNALINKEFIGSSFGAFMCVFRSKYNQYIYYVLNSNIFKFYVGSFLTSTINQLTKHNLYNLAFPFPQKENERKQIIAFLKEKCENINHLITHKKDQLKLLNQYKQSIIYEYVTGKKQVPTEEGAKE